MRTLSLVTISLLAALTGAAWADSSPAHPSPDLASLTGPSRAAVSTTTPQALTSAPAPLKPVSLPVADEVIVRKSERRLYLMRDGKVLRSYRVALGLAPQGAKQREGDFRTPEGRYYLTRRNPRSDYFLSIQVSYPNAEDVARARREHLDPGGAIMVHGLPNTLTHKPRYYATSDWTDGCIALSDSDMVEVWLMTRDDTPIDILP